MTGVDDLVTWLRAQLDEDERVARTANPPPWPVSPAENGSAVIWHAGPSRPTAYVVAPDEYADGINRADAEHIARWDPARVLAEVDAKRQMLDWCDRMVLVDSHGGLMARDARRFRRLLALPYADRPGYREEWRP